MNLLFGAIAATIVLLQSPYFGHLFIWGAGDLGQSGWDKAIWLAPRLLPVLALSLLLTRGLALLRTGAEGAEGRGLALAPFLGLTAALALGLTALSVAAVGLIGFVGLVAPNLARLAGARRPRAELLASLGFGAGLLLATDLLTVLANHVTRDLVPSGAMTALVGAPALIWLMRRRLGAGDQAIYRLPPGPARVPGLFVWPGVALAALAMTLVALTVGRGEAGLAGGLAHGTHPRSALAACAGRRGGRSRHGAVGRPAATPDPQPAGQPRHPRDERGGHLRPCRHGDRGRRLDPRGGGGHRDPRQPAGAGSAARVGAAARSCAHRACAHRHRPCRAARCADQGRPRGRAVRTATRSSAGLAARPTGSRHRKRSSFRSPRYRGSRWS